MLQANAGGVIHVPFQEGSDNVVYLGAIPSSSITTLSRWVSGVMTDVTPIISGSPVPPFTARSFKTCDIDQDYAVLGGFTASCVSSDRCNSWTKVNPTAVYYRFCNIAGDDPHYSYWWSNELGNIGARDTTGNIVSKRGVGAGEIAGGADVSLINLCGGPDI